MIAVANELLDHTFAQRDQRALVAIDLGAESCRVSLLRWSPAGPEISLVHRFPNHATIRNGELRWALNSILGELSRGLRLCADMAKEGIRSIGVDGWAVDYVRLDRNGRALADPFSYRDERTIASERDVHALLAAERMREITGVQLLRINTVYQLFADGTELRSRPWLNLPEYVLHWLGGRPVAERTNASHTQLLGMDGSWSREVFSAIRLEIGNAPDVVPAGTDLGQLRGDLATLPAFEHTRLIAPACHDTASAVASIADDAEDWAYLSSGTWSLVGALVESPINSASAVSANFTNLASADGRTCLHKSVNGLWLLRQCMEQWSAAGLTLSLDEIVEAASVAVPCAGLLDVDDPDLLLQGDMPHRIGQQLRRRGLSVLSSSPEDAPKMASLIFRSLAGRYAEVLAQLELLTGRHFRRLYILGGGSRNSFLNRLTEQATGLKVIPAESESSTLGNFAIQCAALDRESGDATSSMRKAIHNWATRLQT